MKSKLVTSYYAYHNGEPFWGQPNRERWYKYSLACIAGMGCDVVCYTDEGDLGYNQLTEIKEQFNLTNLTIKIYKLSDNPYQERVVAKRLLYPEIYNNDTIIDKFCRSNQIYWMKYDFLEKEYEADTYLYWIDSGLSHHGLFPSFSNKFSVEPDFATYYANHPDGYFPNEYKLYWYDKAFTPETLQRINEYSENKIVNLYRNMSDNNFYTFNEKMNIQKDYGSIYAVAGFFGGNSENMLNYISEAKNLINTILALDNDYLCTEQEIMTYVNADHRDWFKNFKFDTFYHETWVNLYTPDMVSFSHFFLKNLTDNNG
jgi:hypothetical protein